MNEQQFHENRRLGIAVNDVFERKKALDKFKDGDLVYYLECKAICKIVNVFSENIVLDIGKGKIRVCIPSISFFGTPAPIFHATQQNYELLCKLYPNVEFDPPPKRKEPKEVIKAMLASGAIFIPCLVVDYDDNRILDYKKATRHCSSVLIYGISENGRFLSTNPHCSSYKYAVPFDIETGKVIIDFVNGEVVLESENE